MVPKIHHLPPRDTQSSDMDEKDEGIPSIQLARPGNPRSMTEPTPALLLHGWFKDKDTNDWERRPSSSSNSSHHRNRSPYSRSHLRSKSTGSSLLTAPLMTRAHSMPNPQIHNPPRMFDSAGILNTTSGASSSGSSLSVSPMRGSPARSRSPFKPQQIQEEGVYMPQLRSPSWLENSSISAGGAGIQSIQEDSELDLTPRGQSLTHPTPLPPPSRSNSLRSSRRPPSPLHSIAAVPPTSFPASVVDQNAVINMAPPPPHSGSNSPALGPQKYNEAYPSSISSSLHHYASNSSFSISSIPSTPTSARSRSPSISSLEPIEDAPEEEEESEAALEQERLERLKLAAERAADGGESSDGEEGPRRRSLDAPTGRGFGFTRGRGNERKRWSVCGAERRADLDLETIWED